MKTRSVKKTAKETFLALQAKADAYRLETGDWDAWLATASAQDNALDTAREGRFEDYSEEYYECALGSIQCAIEGNCQEDKLFPWFKQAGFTI
jgi:hypothetical protein